MMTKEKIASTELVSNTQKTGNWNPLIPVWLRSGWGILALAMGGYLLIFALWLVFQWGGEEYLALISDLAFLPMSLFAALCAALIVRKTGLPARVRFAWAFIGLAMLSSFVADMIWFYFEIILQQEPFPSLADVFYLAYYGLVFVGLMMLPAVLSKREWRVKFILDIAIVVTAAWLPIWYFLVLPTMADAESDLFTRLIAAAYPVADLILLAGVFSLAFRRMERSQLNSLIFLFAAFSVTFIGDVVYTYASLAGTYESGQLIDITWIVGYYLVGLAALRSLYAGVQADSPVFDRIYERSTQTLPIIVSLLGYGLVVALAVVGLQQGLPLTALVIATVLLTGLILGRQLVEVRENRQLVLEVQATSEQLQEFSRKVEQTAYERERDIKLAAELAQKITGLADLSTLLPNAVELIQQQLELYYAQIYLYDSVRRSLVLRAGSGVVGAELVQRGHRLPVSLASINGAAATERRPVIVADVRESKNFRPNALLPDTCSEVAVPMMIGDRLVGVLDLQSERIGAFQEGELPVLRAVAGQLAVAIENAALFAETQQARSEMEMRLKADTRRAWESFLDGIARSERVAYVYDGHAIALETQPILVDEHALQASIEILGEPVGRIFFESQEGREWMADDRELIQAVSAQVSRQIDDLRLLAQAERYRVEAEEIARRLTHLGWEEYQKDLQTQLGFVYDQSQVRAECESLLDASEVTASYPLVVQDAPIGALEFEGDQSLNDDDLSLIQTVAESLGAHIESLRLNAQTQVALSNMETLNEVTRSASRMLEFEVVLGEILDQILGVAGFGAGLISIEDLTTKRLQLVTHRNLPEAMVTKLTTVGLEGTPCDVVYQSGDTVIVSDLERLPDDLHATNLANDFVHEAMRRPLAMGFHSYLGVALSVKGHVVGTVCLFDQGNKTISSANLELVNSIGQQVGVLVDNARSYQSTQKALAQTEALYKAIAEMNQAESYNDILSALATHTVLGRADQLLVLGVLDQPLGGGEQPQWIYPVAWRSTEPVEIARRYPATMMGGAMAGMSDGNQVAAIGVLDAHSPMMRAVQGLFNLDQETAGISGIPLTLGGQVIGFVLGLYSLKSELSTEDMQQLKAVAGQAAIAVESRLLLEQAQAKARQEQRLREVSANVFAASDVDAILRRAVEQVGRTLGAEAYIYLGQGNKPNGPLSGNGAHEVDGSLEEPELAKM